MTDTTREPAAPANTGRLDFAVQGMTCGSAEDFRDMLKAIAASGLKPVISDVFPFSRVHDAFAAMRDGAHVGKIVVEINA